MGILPSSAFPEKNLSLGCASPNEVMSFSAKFFATLLCDPWFTAGGESGGLEAKVGSIWSFSHRQVVGEARHCVSAFGDEDVVKALIIDELVHQADGATTFQVVTIK
ncbi:9be38c79-75a2-456a-8916-2454f90c23db [Thermothielavioides terrestris]|uniref:9be38c79-75a2-456a-8916-2454f90c23db n=1 Tax=Thermothielavioides terrestris TaxID=2587410 RepID=A0A446BXU7_9PEZI|nr:9be38c79-75a2-456a-8916-2454f90c23db [Thermothielavioides terrestris]